MRKFLILILALAILGLPFMPVAQASDIESMLVYTKVNATSSAISTNVSISTIIPGKHRLLGYQINPIISGSGTVNAGLYDCNTDAEKAASNLKGESACANTATVTVNFPYPVAISDGLTIEQGANSVVSVWYEKSRP